MDTTVDNTQFLRVACPRCLAPNRLLASRTAESPKCGRCGTPLLGGEPIALDEQSFGAFISRTDLPVIVDFLAPWCAPCRMMAPVFEGAARQLALSARFAKVDTDAAPDLARRFGIRSIPTLAIFRNGIEHARAAGAMDAQSLMRWIGDRT